MSNLLEVLGIGALGIVGIVLFLALFFVLGTAFTAFFVALIWNWLGLAGVFGASHLSFWGVVGVAAAINFVYGCLRGIFGRE